MINICRQDLDTLKDYCLSGKRALMERICGKENVQTVLGGGLMAFKDNGAKILAVAHADTVFAANGFSVRNGQPVYAPRTWKTGVWKDGKLQYNEVALKPINTGRAYMRKSTRSNAQKRQHYVVSAALDDRLGCWMIGYLLKRAGLLYDILITDDEEMAQSTAADFVPPKGKKYNWIFEFDRRGTEVVLYQYDDVATTDLLHGLGYAPEFGSFSDISELDKLGCKAFNFGVGYHHEHSDGCYANVLDIQKVANHFVGFYDAMFGTHLPHTYTPRRYYYSSMYGDDDYSYSGTGYVGRAAELEDYKKDWKPCTRCGEKHSAAWMTDGVCHACMGYECDCGRILRSTVEINSGVCDVCWQDKRRANLHQLAPGKILCEVCETELTDAADIANGYCLACAEKFEIDEAAFEAAKEETEAICFSCGGVFDPARDNCCPYCLANFSCPICGTTITAENYSYSNLFNAYTCKGCASKKTIHPATTLL